MAGSMRDTIKVLTTTFSAATTPYPLPAELQHTIQAFLDRYDHIEGHDSQRFHEELLSLYMRHVAGSPEKHGPFLSALRICRPALTGEARLNEWWELVLKPTIEGVGHKRHELEDAREFLLSILIFDKEGEREGELAHLSGAFTKKILDSYLARTRIPSSAEDVVSPENEAISHELESILVAFGRKKPKLLLLTLDRLFVQKQYRIQGLNLLSAFVRLQPPHLYLVLETSLIQHLESCLLIDTSSTVIELALMVLIMFLPHITGSLTSDNHLPKLFLIYSRLLCWDKLGTPNDGREEDEQTQDGSEDDSEANEAEPTWEKFHQSIDYPDAAPPALLHYFTFLYGLFPLNFMSFIRKPRKALKSLDFAAADDFEIDPDLIHSRTEPYRRVHLLHPNMFTTTIDDEISENRWLNSDPADIVTECMDLCVAVSATLADPGPPPTTKLPDLPLPPIPSEPPRHDFSLDDDGTTANESAVSWRNTQSTMYNASANGQPETFEIPPKAKSVKSVKSSKSASPLLKCKDMDSPTLGPAKEDKKQQLLGAPLTTLRLPAISPSLENFAQAVTTGSSSPTHSEFQNQSMASLQREIMLLRNDLNFERYLKLQHLAHIGQLQRKNIKEATAEAETQNLINTNRTLKARLTKANELYAQLKKETLTSRSQSKKWESELSSKVRSYRDDQKVWQGDETNLRFELQKTQQDCEHLKRMVEKAEAEQLKAQQRTRALEFELEDYGNVRRELEAAQEKIIVSEDQNRDFTVLMKERNELRNDLEIANMRLNSRESERERSIKAYERRIMDLESRLQSAEKTTGKPGALSPSVQQMLDSALAASNAKLQQLKKTHYRLLEQYTELEMKYHDLEGERQADIGRMQTPEKPRFHDYEKDSPSRNFSIRRNTNQAYDSKYLPPLSADVHQEDYSYYDDYSSPVSTTSPSTNVSARPVRLESLPQGRPMKEPLNIGYGQDFSAAYDASLNAHFQSSAPAETIASSGKSTFSIDTNSSKGDKKDKVSSKSEVRVYGRGGAQNIGKKLKEKEQQKKASSKSGGFRGLKNIVDR
ncbi:Hamartin protein-domain-containing protein [Lophiotrema nucula]|uniref:Hamartin protein-domain-containing protein n=1 Tax=Lophiotrema nucula TaxID=690887 RepID=A0A6A5ZRS0_9PLEO|nr:Hamartin protein-domain-containing protein [Lophiotrema nucula]